MIVNMTTREFDELSLAGKKRIFSLFLKSKVNNIVSGSMTNGKWGEYRVRHDECAYSTIKVNPSKLGLTELTVYNYITKTWEGEAK